MGDAHQGSCFEALQGFQLEVPRLEMCCGYYSPLVSSHWQTDRLRNPTRNCGLN